MYVAKIENQIIQSAYFMKGGCTVEYLENLTLIKLEEKLFKIEMFATLLHKE